MFSTEVGGAGWFPTLETTQLKRVGYNLFPKEHSSLFFICRIEAILFSLCSGFWNVLGCEVKGEFLSCC